ncbi:MAG: hypothetical protein BWZ10_02894 [candidate division BRC1 bacterium ADurb.BinA364]|nr:MAG: hypothetical protein BWZ10_02894 [candidate division BRC1 bacterium ADurb.BinA364]
MVCMNQLPSMRMAIWPVRNGSSAPLIALARKTSAAE